MQLTTKQSYELLAKHGCYVTEACDRCGGIVGVFPLAAGGRGAVVKYFTRHGECGVWCSRECRDGGKAHAPGTCKGCGAKLPEGKRRGALYCDDACRKLATRSRTGELSRTNGPVYAA